MHYTYTNVVLILESHDTCTEQNNQIVQSLGIEYWWQLENKVFAEQTLSLEIMTLSDLSHVRNVFLWVVIPIQAMSWAVIPAAKKDGHFGGHQYKKSKQKAVKQCLFRDLS